MEMECRTKAGHVMNRRLRERLVLVMADSKRLSLKEVAAELGVSRRTVQDYLTTEVRAEIAERKTNAPVTLDDVDKAMMRQACAGNVAAARLVYMRMAQRGETGPLPTLDEMEAELVKLKELETKRRKTGKQESDNGARDDAGAAVADGEGG